ncbi:MAG TPA: transcription termination/antitermination factor NusG [Spirochaetia bacterium]|nr:MAG: transcription termination/antitermination factor NusG [Spirochaetes bacterium GWB1_36_13]HCL58195.1 transcription termination/antitermination factor NusG [Spirochaetia bacterium]
MGKKWYVLQVVVGGEDKVARSLEVLKEGFEKDEEKRGIIGNIRVPVEETQEIKNGKKRKVKRKMFPGYVFMEIGFPQALIDAKKIYSEIVLLNGVGTFIGARNDGLPQPIPDKEVEEILVRMGEIKKSVHKPTIAVDFEIGNKVRVVEGPFKDLSGKIETIDFEKGKVKVKIEIFGMPTPVDLDMVQIEKV